MLAVHDNVAVKVSGACTLSHEPFPYEDIWDPLDRVFDAFGFDRCMWGTDWTRAVGLLTYDQGVEAFRVANRPPKECAPSSWVKLSPRSTIGQRHKPETAPFRARRISFLNALPLTDPVLL